MIENREETVLALNRIKLELPDAWEEGLFDSTEYAMELDKRNPVLEGVVKYLALSEITDESALQKAAIKELNKRYRSMGIEEGVPKAVKNWLKGTPVNPAYRENLYNLCMALELDDIETTEFFLKNYMTIPFNYKDRIDAIYYFGLTHRLKYQDIKALIEESEINESIQEDNNEKTVNIGINIADIDDISKFKEFLKGHTYSRDNQYSTATKEINALVDSNTKLAESERVLKPELIKLGESAEERFNDNYKDKDAYQRDLSDNMSGLLYVIYGYDSQARYEGHLPGISKAINLPKKFRESFPNDSEFYRIRNRCASPDTYRKALIIMKFYNFYCSNMLLSVFGAITPDLKGKKLMTLEEYCERDTDDIRADLEDFYFETSKLLAQCGFEQMYARNPFDWLILYCANSTDPMETLRELLAQRYLDMDDEL